MAYNWVQVGDIIPTQLVNNFSALQNATYWRACDLFASNMASFCRVLHLNGILYDKPHRLDRILKRKPNQLDTCFSFWQTNFFRLFNSANSYAKLVRTSTNDIAAMYNMNEFEVTPYRFYPGDVPKPEECQQWYFISSTNEHLAASDMLHIKGIGTGNDMIGDNPMFRMASTLQRGQAYNEYQNRIVKSGTFIRGTIELPSGLDQDQIDKIMAEVSKYNGPGSVGKTNNIAILFGGAKLTNNTISPTDLDLAEHIELNDYSISQFTGIAPQYLFIKQTGGTAYNTSIPQQGEDLVRFFFRNWIDNVEDELTTKLLTEAELEQGFSIKLDPRELLSGDTVAEEAIAADSVAAGIRTENEGRALIDLPPVADPSADKLVRLGDTTPQEVRQTNAKPSDSTFAALQPILEDTSDRIEAKATKAFQSAAKKTGQDRTVWSNVFAEQQAGYVRQSFSAIGETIHAMTGDKIDVAKLAQRYSDEIKKRANGNEPTPLIQIVGDVLNGI